MKTCHFLIDSGTWSWNRLRRPPYFRFNYVLFCDWVTNLEPSERKVGRVAHAHICLHSSIVDCVKLFVQKAIATRTAERSATVWTAVFRLPQSATNLLSLRLNIQRDSGVHHVTAIWQPHSVTTRRRET